MNKLTLQRFWSKVEKTKTCWIWKASKRNKGYGAFVWAGNDGEIIQGRAHRFSYELHHGNIPTGICVLHRCDNPACVRPDHLFLGTKRDNNLDMALKGRHVPGGTHCGKNGKWKRGVNHWNYRIPRHSVAKIKKDRASGMSYTRLSKKYSVSQGYIWRIINGVARKEVEE